MRTVWKFKVPICDWPVVKMPPGAPILRVDMQGNELFLWAQVETEMPFSERQFRLAGTGHDLEHGDPDGVFLDFRPVGTFFMHDGALVFHLFEVGA